MGEIRRTCGARGLGAALTLSLLGLAAPAPLLAQQPLGLTLDAGVTAHDNVNRARLESERLSDQSIRANLSKSLVQPLTGNSRLTLQIFTGAERFLEYRGLSRVWVGAQAEYQYRASGEFLAPTYAVFLRSAYEGYESNLRDGLRHSLGLSIRQPVTDRIHLFGALARNVSNTSETVFNVRDHSARMNLDYALTPNGTLYFGAEYRRGEAVSTARPSLWDIDVAEALVRDDVFTDATRFSYRVRAKTSIASIGYNFAVGERGALDVSWTWVRSVPLARPGFASSLRSDYVANQLSAAWLYRF